jgi:hypothetical protein
VGRLITIEVEPQADSSPPGSSSSIEKGPPTTPKKTRESSEGTADKEGERERER